MSVLINKPRPLFRRELQNAPAHPLGERVLVREFPVAEKSAGGIDIPDVAKEHYFAGTLVAVGDQAADRLYDLGVELGDEVLYAKYAGLIQEWQHVVGKDNDKCAHDGVMEFVPAHDPRWKLLGGSNENTKLRACRTCETLVVSERVIILQVDDLCLDVDLQARLESGVMKRERQETPDGKTRYVIVRDENRADAFETKEAV